MAKKSKGKNHSIKKGPYLHRSAEFADLSYLIGEPLKVIRGIRFDGDRDPDGKVEIVKDYGRTILLRMEFIESIWGLEMPPRYVLTMQTKASIVCGDLVLKRVNGGFITADMVSAIGTEEALGLEVAKA